MPNLSDPRSARPDEIDAVARLVDKVFFDGKPGEMCSRFPYFIHPDNCDNLLVIADGDRLVAHAGMTQRWALIRGASVRVACLGAVATDAASRGKGLGGELVSACVQKALADGVDFMLISGDRPLYRRAGAAPIGGYLRATITEPASLPPGITLREGTPDDFDVCAALYNRKSVRFVREPLDWQAYAESRYAMWNRSKLWLVHNDGRVAAYLVVTEPRDGKSARVAEYGGDEDVVAAASPAVLAAMDCAALEVFLHSSEKELLAAFWRVAKSIEPCDISTTIRLVNPAQFGARLRPCIAEQTGTVLADTFAIRQHPDGVLLSFDGAKLLADGLAELADILFGSESSEPGLITPFDEILPVPAPWYGLNFV